MLFRILAKILSIDWIANMLIRQAMKTEYFHLPGYMDRWWLFNGYPKGDKTHTRPHPWIPFSLRIHHILREDLDDHPHDHPANARTFILKGWYIENRDGIWYTRVRGDTVKIGYGEYHNISAVSEGGVWTLFALGPKKGNWGFLVGGEKIPWEVYLSSPDDPRDGR
jgi:hypothetical protein